MPSNTTDSNRHSPVRYIREAFLHPLNVLFLSIAALAALGAAGTAYPVALIVVVALGLELLYLGTVPGTGWFRRLVDRRARRGDAQRDEGRALFYELDAGAQKQYLALRSLNRRIAENFDALPLSNRLIADSLRPRMDALLEGYLRHLHMEKRYNEYLMQVSADAISLEIRALQKQMTGIPAGRLYEVKRQRLHILLKRLERLQAAEEKVEICRSHQQTIEDATSYVYEKSLIMARPEDMGQHLDELMAELDETSLMISELQSEDWSDGAELSARAADRAKSLAGGDAGFQRRAEDRAKLPGEGDGDGDGEGECEGEAPPSTRGADRAIPPRDAKGVSRSGTMVPSV